jgi:hypothetical protein
MTIDKKPAPGANRAGSSTAFDSHILSLPHWLVSLPTTVACIVSLAAPIVAALSGLIAGGRL